MRVVRTFLIAALLWPCASLAGVSPLNPGWGTVFPAEQAAQLARQCSRAAPRAEGAWLPTPADIAKLEPGLTQTLIVAKVQPGAYYRQYGGLIVGGRHIIYVNGVRNAVVTGNWRTAPISICDGGALAFGVEYDPATGRFEHFAFNGAL
ncbi:MAG TPA: hypothetical protein VHZ78_09535 [Rhizomicrobium sp.]|jgi:hypothetical protein|nr:hypothetical protein [Rhizomicrobium sp.]